MTKSGADPTDFILLNQTVSQGSCVWVQSKCKRQRGSKLQKWIAVIHTPQTDTHRIDATRMQIMTFHFCRFDPRWHLHFGTVRLQITTGRYRTKNGQAIRAEFIQEFVLPTWTC